MPTAEHTVLLAGQAEIKTMLQHNTEICAQVSEKCDIMLDVMNSLVQKIGDAPAPAPPAPTAVTDVSRGFCLPLKTVAEVSKLNRDLAHQPTFNSFVSSLFVKYVCVCVVSNVLVYSQCPHDEPCVIALILHTVLSLIIPAHVCG